MRTDDGLELLAGGAQSGTTITVPAETSVTDTAALSGANSQIATGGINYAVYSDPACTHLVTEAGEVSVNGQTAAASNAETLAPGATYYWQASYTGDSHNGASQGVCGSEVETVSPQPTCSKAVGHGTFGVGTLRQSVTNSLSTVLTSKERFVFAWDGGEHGINLLHLSSASCVISGATKTFIGHGTAGEKGVKGYAITFTISITGGHSYLTLAIEKNSTVIEEFLHEQLVPPKTGFESIS